MWSADNARSKKEITTYKKHTHHEVSKTFLVCKLMDNLVSIPIEIGRASCRERVYVLV